MMSSQEIECVLRRYLSRSLQVNEDAWRIDFSPISGRGLFATKDLKPNEVIFHDKAVAIGPRLKLTTPFCVVCYKTGLVETCSRGCRLPVCSTVCSSSAQHAVECEYLKTKLRIDKDDQWSLLLLRALTPLRCLNLNENDKEVVRCLQCFSRKHHSIEVDILKKYLGQNLTAQDEQWIRLCCLAMDCNAFETLSVHGQGDDQTSTSLRGLYPLAAIMNHECSPNTYHTYNNECVMKLKAARSINKGEEITTSYSSLFWNTSIRRTHLQKSKQFLCLCERCKDPTEYGSLLSGLSCPQCTSGIILPISSLNFDSPWRCNSCSSQISPEKVSELHATQGMVLRGIDTTDPESVINFLESNIPLCKQIAIQLKLGLIWQIGHLKGYLWQELPVHLLNLKEKFCHQLLQLLADLHLGECRMKGIILFELHCALCEKLKKNHTEENSLKLELKDTLTNALEILHEDASKPLEFFCRLKDFQNMVFN